jgi:hypothetical protein
MMDLSICDPQTITELREVIVCKMEEIPEEMVANVTESVTRRIQRCIDVDGHQIID